LKEEATSPTMNNDPKMLTEFIKIKQRCDIMTEKSQIDIDQSGEGNHENQGRVS